MLPKIDLVPNIDLLRIEENYGHGTFGVWVINTQVFCLTLEPRDEENKLNISSIPAQQYVCKRYKRKKHPNTFQIMDVPGRTYVLIHILNFDDQTEACVGLGTEYGWIGDRKCILNSKRAFDAFMKVMEGVDKFILTIREVY